MKQANKPEWIEKLKALIQEYDTPKPKSLVFKSVDAEERRITAVVMSPRTKDNPDLHNDFFTAEDIKKGCESFNTHCMQPNIEHLVNVGSEDCVIEESFILPIDATIGDQFVAKGSWIQVWKINADDLWNAVKDGTFTGFSPGFSAIVEDVE
jgi:hypothetical protein